MKTQPRNIHNDSDLRNFGRASRAICVVEAEQSAADFDAVQMSGKERGGLGGGGEVLDDSAQLFALDSASAFDAKGSPALIEAESNQNKRRRAQEA